MKPDNAPNHPFFIAFMVSAIVHCLVLVCFGVSLFFPGARSAIRVMLLDRSLPKSLLKVYCERIEACDELPFILPLTPIGIDADEVCGGGVNSFRVWQDMPVAQVARYVSARADAGPEGYPAAAADPFLLKYPSPGPEPAAAGMEIDFLNYPVRHVVAGQEGISALAGAETVVAVLYVDGFGNVVSSFVENSSGNGAVDAATLGLCRCLRFDRLGPGPDPYGLQTMKITFRMDAAACVGMLSDGAGGRVP